MEIDFDWLEKAFNQPLSETERQTLKESVEVMIVPAGSPIMHQGAEGNALYIVRSGNTNISRKAGGKETILATEDKSRVFGEINMFSAEPASVKVVAALPCTIYKITREHFEGIMMNRCKLALSMLAFIVRNMGDVIHRLDLKQTATASRRY